MWALRFNPTYFFGLKQNFSKFFEEFYLISWLRVVIKLFSSRLWFSFLYLQFPHFSFIFDASCLIFFCSLLLLPVLICTVSRPKEFLLCSALFLKQFALFCFRGQAAHLWPSALLSLFLQISASDTNFAAFLEDPPTAKFRPRRDGLVAQIWFNLKRTKKDLQILLSSSETRSWGVSGDFGVRRRQVAESRKRRFIRSHPFGMQAKTDFQSLRNMKTSKLLLRLNIFSGSR